MRGRLRDRIPRRGRRSHILQQRGLLPIQMLLRPRTTQPRPPRQLPGVRLVVRPLLLPAAPADRVQMPERKLIREMPGRATLPMVRVHEVAVLQVQLVLVHEGGGGRPLLREEERADDRRRRRRRLGLILGLPLRTGRGGARVRRVEYVRGEAAALVAAAAAAVLSDRFRARQSGARDRGILTAAAYRRRRR